MTFLEKLKEDNPEYKEADVNAVIGKYCPDEYGYENESECTETANGACTRCWNREMPDTEPNSLNHNQETIEQKEKMQNAYDKGLNDAWEFVKKTDVSRTPSEAMELFDFFEVKGYREIFRNFTPQEALAKLKAYEEAQEQRKIKVGNVVENKIDTVKAVVMDNGSQEFLWQVFTENGCIELWKECEFKKTGKHIDISSILEQIGE